MENAVQSFYGNRLRVRICGICVSNGKLLLVNHQGVGNNNFWSPPGGGLDFGETAEACLKREFLEETGLEIDVSHFLFACEFIKAPLHAIELFFDVKPTTYKLKTGTDPEDGSPAIIKETKFHSWEEIQNIPSDELHGIFKFAEKPADILNLRGYFKI